LILVVNANAGQAETSTANNVVAIPITVGVPNLVLTSAAAPATAPSGGDVVLSFTVSNVGAVLAPASRSDSVYISRDTTFDYSDTFVASRGFSGQAAGTDASAQVTGTISPYVGLGDFYLLFIADSGNSQGETDETDNVKAVPIKITGPDLVVSSVETTP